MLTSRGLFLIPFLLLAGCNSTLVDEPGVPLPRPATLNSIALDGKVALYWSEESYRASPTRFDHYAVYSSAYDFDHDTCLSPWVSEGTTVSPEFLSAAMINGVPRCFSVSAVTTDLVESTRSDAAVNTPRFQANGLAWSIRQVSPTTAGVRFWRDDNGDGVATRNELGNILSATSDVDFTLERFSDGKVYMIPSRAQSDMQVFGTAPVSELAPIGEAPLTGYVRTGFEAIPGWAYLFRTVAADGYYRFGAIRVLYAGDTFILIDWALQTDPGNPMLFRAAP